MTLPAKITKKLKSLGLECGEAKITLEITDGEIDLIQLDMWLTELFKAEFEKEQKAKSKFIVPDKKIIT